MKQLLFLLLGMIVLAGCASPPAEREENNSAQSGITETDGAALAYRQYKEEYDRWCDRFRKDMSDPLVTESGPTILVQQVRPARQVSTEGSLLTRYQRNGVVVRYDWQIFGEQGQTHYSYILLEDTLYIQRLRTTYNSYVFRSGPGLLEPLYYTLEDVVIGDGAVYILDHIQGQALPYEAEWDIYSVEALEAVFHDGAPVD